MTKAVFVKFRLDEETWNTVTVNKGDDELITEVEELSTEFIVEYEDRDSWVSAMNRFQGMIEYQVKGEPGYVESRS